MRLPARNAADLPAAVVVDSSTSFPSSFWSMGNGHAKSNMVLFALIANVEKNFLPKAKAGKVKKSFPFGPGGKRRYARER